MKLTRKFVFMLWLGIILVLIGNAYTRVQREIAFFDRDARHDATLVGQAIARAMLHVWGVQSESSALDLFDDVKNRSPHYQIRFVWLDSNAGSAWQPSFPVPELVHVARGQVWSKRIESGQGLLYTFVPISPPGTRPGAIEIRESLQDERRYTRATWQNTAVATLGLSVLVALLAMWIGVILVGRPTRMLVEKVRRIGMGDLSGPLHARQNDELGEIALEVNAMCERLREAQLRIEKETEERIAAEQQLRHADRLMTVGKLASGMAHELGTPLNVVSGRAQMIFQGQSGGEEAKADARIIWEQTKRMTKIMRELLDFARPRPAQRAWIELRAIADQTLTMLAPMARSRDVELKVLDGEPARANVDAAQMQQVLTNLIVNAIHAIQSGGNVTVGFRHAVAKAPADQGGRSGPCLVIEIQDTGCGIDASVVQRIFEPFFTTKDVGEGTGLGLSVTHGIVREHGGFITVHSVLGKGTTFSVHLPLDGADEQESSS